MTEPKAPKMDVRNIFKANTVNIDDFMRDLREKDAGLNPFQFWRCEDRNIVLIGRTRTGKSTIAEVVKDIMHVASPQQLYSETKQIQYHSIATDTAERKWYHFNFIDIPGFFDISTTHRDKLSNERIVSYLQELMQKDITTIHMFAFVFNLAAGINERDLETMVYVKKMYPHLTKYMALVITHCEQVAEAERDRVKSNFFQHPTVVKNKLQEYFQLGVLFMGCFRHESVSRANDVSMYCEYNNILDMRKEFVETCIKCDQPFNFYQGTTPDKNLCSIS